MYVKIHQDFTTAIERSFPFRYFQTLRVGNFGIRFVLQVAKSSKRNEKVLSYESNILKIHPLNSHLYVGKCTSQVS